MKALKNSKMKKQSGFTLIELVIVIVILGILATTAAPKFIDLQSDAKASLMQAVKGSIEAGIAGVHAKSLIAGNNNDAKKATPSNVMVAGAEIEIGAGWPLATLANFTGLDSFMDTSTDDFDIFQSGDTTKIVYMPKQTTKLTNRAAALAARL